MIAPDWERVAEAVERNHWFPAPQRVLRSDERYDEWKVDIRAMLDAVEWALAHGPAIDNAETMWWCVPFHEHGAANVSEPCVAGSDHDKPYKCRWVRIVEKRLLPQIGEGE